MDVTHHLTIALDAAIALANTFGTAQRQGRAPAAVSPMEVDAALRLATRRVPEITAQVLEAYREGGTRLYLALQHVVDGDEDAAAAQINELFERTHAAPRLVRHDDDPWHLHFAVPGPAAMLADMATAAGMLIGSSEAGRLHLCGAERCDNLFLDSTRSRTRRFCSTSCQNRMKVAAFRSRA